MKRRVHFIESYRESRQLKRDADEEVEDGLGAAHRPADWEDRRYDLNMAAGCDGYARDRVAV